MKRTFSTSIIYLFFLLTFVACGSSTSSSTDDVGNNTGNSQEQSDDEETTLSISQYGITWNFDEPVQYGQFVNGDYWVIGPVTVTSISPAPADEHIIGSQSCEADNTDTCTEFDYIDGDVSYPTYAKSCNNNICEYSRYTNGSMVNPLANNDHGYDSRVSGFSDSNKIQLPINLTANSSLVSTISWLIDDCTKGTTDCFNALYRRIPQTIRPTLKVAAVLTVLSEIPPEDAFRPPYSGNEKTIYRISQINRNLLPNLPADEETVSQLKAAYSDLSTTEEIIARYNNLFSKPWLDHQSEWVGSYLHPTQNMAEYGRDISIDVSEAGLLLMLDIENDELLTNYIQVGIDLFGIAENGGYWGTVGGGHGVGRKWPILFAGMLLEDEQMSDMMRNTGTVVPGETIFQEDCQTFTITQEDIDRYPYDESVDYTPGPEANDSVIWHGIKQEQLGTPGWGARHCSQPDNDHDSRGYQICCTSHTYVGQALSAHLMSAEELWGHDPFFNYVDSWVESGNPGYSEDESLYRYNIYTYGNSFIRYMWERYR